MTELDPFTVDCPECRQPAGHDCHWPGYGSQHFPHSSRVFRAEAEHHQPEQPEDPA